jgi:uncharacterized protein
MSVDAYDGILVAAVFLGAVVQGFSGFAFSAVAGAILLQFQSPATTIPLLMICSLLIQGYVLLRLRAVVSLKDSLPYISAGSVGVILATLAFDFIDPRIFRPLFGAFLILYALSILLRPRTALLSTKERPMGKSAVGFAGGLIGGLTAMPAVALVIWGDANGMTRLAQRAIIQPFIAAMQGLAVVLLLLTAPAATVGTIQHLPLAVPAMFGGAALGLFLFGKVSDVGFRRAVSMLLLASGIALMACQRM